MSSTTPAAPRGRALLGAILAASLLAGTVTAIDAGSAPSAHATGSFGALPTGDFPRDIAMANDFAYVANRNAGTVSIFESTTWNPISTVTVGLEPVQANANRSGSEVWVSNFSDGTVSVIDTSTNTVTDTISMGGAPYMVLFSADDSTAYVLNYLLETVQVVNTTTLSFTSVGSQLGFPVSGVLSADEQFLYFDGGAGMDRIYKLDLSSGTVLFDETLPLADPDNDGVTFLTNNPAGTEMWAVINSGGGNGRVDVYNATATAVIASIPLLSTPGEVSFSSSGEFAYVTEYLTDTVAVIDAQSFEVITRVSVGNEPFALATAPSGLVAVLNAVDDTIEIIGLTKERLAGDNRYATAVEVSKKAFPIGANTVFLASGAAFPDALAAGPAAGLVDGALLLTDPSSLPTVVRDELMRLNPDTIYIVGGVGAVSAAVEAAVKTIQPNTIRIQGENRYATANALVDEMWTTTVDEVYIATGGAYPDALSAGAVAAAAGLPVILVNGSAASVPSATLSLITSLNPSTITIAGGTGAVSAGIMSQLTSQYPSSTVRRLAGDTRYETSTAISADAYPSSETVLFATGANFPDALAAASLAARANAPLYLTLGTGVTPGALAGVYEGQAPYLFLLGGTGVLSPAVEALTPCS